MQRARDLFIYLLIVIGIILSIFILAQLFYTEDIDEDSTSPFRKSLEKASP